MTGEELLAVIVDRELAVTSLRWFHSYDPRRDQLRGFPDLVIVGRAGILWRECKGPGERLTAEQTAWKWLLLSARADWATWRPADLERGLVRKQIRAIT